MDFIEKAFGKLWLTKKQKTEALESTVKVVEIQKYIELIVDYTLSDKKSFQIFGSLWSSGFYGDSLFLPDIIGFSKDFQFNKDCYLYLTLKSCGLRALEIKSESYPRSRTAQRLESLKHMPEVNRWLDAKFPFFSEFEKNHLKRFKENLNIKTPQSNKVLSFWSRALSSRDLDMKRDFNMEAQELLKVQKRNDEIPDYLRYSTPQVWESEKNFSSEVEGGESELKDREQGEQEQRNRSERPKKAGEEEEELNPIAHSFEKLEVADDYDGGRKVDSSEDELGQSLNSLEEVELNQVTTEGETTKSVYQQDGQFFTNRELEAEVVSSSKAFLYSEWSQKKKTYLQNFCKLYVSELKTESSDLSFRNEISKKYKAEVTLWSKKISSIFNEPLWFRRQKEGPEIDIDALVRAQTDVTAGVTPSSDIYALKKVYIRDLAVLILFDQSLSTDSWVCNRRVLDVIKESIGVTGLIFEKFISSVMIAGVSSATRHHIDFKIYKNFEDHWDQFFKEAPFIEPKGYTRLGPALRHATVCLKKINSKKKLLLVLTDGKPTDLDSYEGSRGIYDVKKAVMEAEQLGFDVVALTVEKETKAQFSKMFKRFVVLQSPDNLPQELYKVLLKALRGRD